MGRVVGLDGDPLGIVIGKPAAAERDRQSFGLPGLDRTVGPTVELGPSPAMRFDLQIGRALVSNIEGEADRLI